MAHSVNEKLSKLGYDETLKIPRSYQDSGSSTAVMTRNLDVSLRSVAKHIGIIHNKIQNVELAATDMSDTKKRLDQLEAATMTHTKMLTEIYEMLLTSARKQDQVLKMSNANNVNTSSVNNTSNVNNVSTSSINNTNANANNAHKPNLKELHFTATGVTANFDVNNDDCINTLLQNKNANVVLVEETHMPTNAILDDIHMVNIPSDTNKCDVITIEHDASNNADHSTNADSKLDKSNDVPIKLDKSNAEQDEKLPESIIEKVRNVDSSISAADLKPTADLKSTTELKKSRKGRPSKASGIEVSANVVADLAKPVAQDDTIVIELEEPMPQVKPKKKTLGRKPQR